MVCVSRWTTYISKIRQSDFPWHFFRTEKWFAKSEVPISNLAKETYKVKSYATPPLPCRKVKMADTWYEFIIPSEVVFKAFKNRKRSGFVDR